VHPPQGRGSWELGVWPLKICRKVRMCFCPPRKMSHSFIQNCCWITMQVSRYQGWKTCVKMDGKTNNRLSGTGIVDCLEIVDVRCNLKQFDGLTWLTLTPPHVLREINATDMMLLDTVQTSLPQTTSLSCSVIIQSFSQSASTYPNHLNLPFFHLQQFSNFCISFPFHQCSDR